MFFLLIFLRAVTYLLPLCFLYKIGAFVGWLSYFVFIKRRKIVLINLGLCFPELSIKKRKKIAKKNFINLGVGLFETFVCWFKPIKSLQSIKINVSGLENLNSSNNLGKGCIILSSHMASMELMSYALSRHGKFGFVYRPHENRLVLDYMIKGRSRFNNISISRYSMIETYRFLKKKNNLVYLIDQDLGLNSSCFVPFFNIQASTVNIMYKLSKKTDSLIIPFMYHRDKGEYNLCFYEPINLDKFKNMSDDEKGNEVARIYNSILEEHIRKFPEQYFWVHRRFKTRPKGEVGFYNNI